MDSDYDVIWRLLANAEINFKEVLVDARYEIHVEDQALAKFMFDDEENLINMEVLT